MRGLYGTATVTVSAPVDGTGARPSRPRAARRVLATTTREVTVDERVMAAAHAALRPGERLTIVNATTVRLVNIRVDLEG